MQRPDRWTRLAGAFALPALVLAPACAPASGVQATPEPAPAPAAPAEPAAPAGAGLPLRHEPQPTTAAITPADLMTRLYVVADDSMMGREAGTEGNVIATRYIAEQARRIGLRPAGEDGTYFQTVPLVRRSLDEASTLRVVGGEGAAPAFGADFIPVRPYGDFFPFAPRFRSAEGVPVVFGGRIGGEVIDPAAAAGKAVVFAPPLGEDGQPSFQFWEKTDFSEYGDAAAVLVAAWDLVPPQGGLRDFLQGSSEELPGDGDADDELAPGLLVTRALAERLVGAPLDEAEVGRAGLRLAGDAGFAERPVEHPARNVVAVLPGSDPALAGEYVAIGSHNDHEGIEDEAIDHYQMRAYNWVVRPGGAEDPMRQPTAEELPRIQAVLDSLLRTNTARPDSIANGADDDGSGTVAMLEIAQAMASAPERPRRSVLFVWHTAEEKGLLGSEWYTDHPTVPLDSIVAQLNIDMIGRGRADDEELGGPAYLQLIGSRRLSTELGDLVEAVNEGEGHGFAFDYTYDADGHPMNIYCRSDHYNYARYGIPVTFFTTGGHRDYHQITDEPQYVDYDKLARVSGLIHDVALAVANRDARPTVDGRIMGPDEPCQQ